MNTAHALCCVALWLFFAASTTAQPRKTDNTHLVQDLNVADWQISNQNGSLVVSSVHLPKMVLEALYEGDMLPAGDPISGYNDRTYAWVNEEIWTFETEFNVSKNALEQQAVDLVLTGVDTVAEVYINDGLIAELENAHREYRLDVKSLLTVGENLLSIVFYPATKFAKRKAAEYPYVVPMQTYPRGYDHFNFIRKPASDFGWDWGPAFSPCGVYGRVVLQAYSTAFLTGASILQKHHETGRIDLYFDAVLQGSSDGESGSLSVQSDSYGWSGSADVILDKGENIATVKVTVKDNYNLWWPVGFGAAQLYNFTLFYSANGSSGGEKSESELGRRVGFRTIELVEEPLRDPSGFSFYFRVNGIPTYARGANMIPLQIFHSKNSEAKYRHMVEDAIAANMNMLRIWGGGLYQLDSFYDIADEMGVLIWQEAMFACAQYPRDSKFLANVAAEVSYQARRIGHHASLAIWGGNNEVETAFAWFPESRNNVNLFSVDYQVLFVETVRKAIIAVDADVAFVDSSPAKGIYSLSPYSKRWGDPSAVNAGDVHFYDYSSNCLNMATYPRAKFVSEYGFMSYPSFSVYRNYTITRDWSIESNMSDYRQRHPNGNAELQAQMQLHFHPIAANATNSALQQRLFQQWIYLTQVQQALCYETAITYWRRLKAAPDARTMGVLYWQLNDIWAGPSWSGMDHGGHWKLLMYTVRKIFAPVAVSGTYNATQADALSVYVTNDQPWSVSGEVVVEFISWGSRSYDMPVVSQTVPFEVGPLGSKVVGTMAIKPKLTNSSLTVMDTVVRLKATAQGNPQELTAQTCLMDEDDPFTSICTPAQGMKQKTQHLKPSASPSNGSFPAAPASASTLESYSTSQVVWLTEPKEAAIGLDPRITVGRFKQIDSKSASFRISSRGVAALVYLDAEQVNGIFSDNGFLLLPWEPQVITFTSRSPFKVASLQSSLSFMSLADTLSGGSWTAY